MHIFGTTQSFGIRFFFGWDIKIWNEAFFCLGYRVSDYGIFAWGITFWTYAFFAWGIEFLTSTKLGLANVIGHSVFSYFLIKYVSLVGNNLKHLNFISFHNINWPFACTYKGGLKRQVNN